MPFLRTWAEAGISFSVTVPIVRLRASTGKLEVGLSNEGVSHGHFHSGRGLDHAPATIDFPFEHILMWSLHPTSNRFSSEHSQRTVLMGDSFVAMPVFPHFRSFLGPSDEAQSPSWGWRRLPYSALWSRLACLLCFFWSLQPPALCVHCIPACAHDCSLSSFYSSVWSALNGASAAEPLLTSEMGSSMVAFPFTTFVMGVINHPSLPGPRMQSQESEL